MSAKKNPTPEPEPSTGPTATGGAPPLTPPGAKADLGKRFIAVLIDAVLAVVVGFVPIVGGIVATAYWLVRDGLEIEFMDHRSLGKKLMKLRPITETGRPLDIMDSVKRNWVFAIGGLAPLMAWTIILLPLALLVAGVALILALVEAFLVLTDPEGKRLGDKIAGTKVVEVDE